LWESEIEDVFHGLDRLTLDEVRMTGTEMLQIVLDLVSNINLKFIMGGMEPTLLTPAVVAHRIVRKDDTTSMQDTWQALGTLGLLLAYCETRVAEHGANLVLLDA
jgi:hypothetical protein